MKAETAETLALRFLVVSGRLFLGNAQDEEAVALLRHPMDWSHLLERAEAEGMTGLLAHALRRLAHGYSLDLPLAPFIQARHSLFARNGVILAELSALREALRQGGRQAIVLKGGALIETAYRGHPAMRPLSDVDLLVRPQDLAYLQEVLLQRGYSRPSPSSNFFSCGWAAFDLHTDLLGVARIRRRALAFHLDMDGLWREASPIDSEDSTLLVPSPFHQLLHLVIHALKHSFSRLVWFVDLGLLLERVKCKELVDRAEATGALRALSYALFEVEALMGVEVPREVLARLPRFNRIERMFLQGVVTRQPMETLGELIVAFSIPGLAAKAGYLLELGFPRLQVLAEVFPNTPSYLLYPRRLVQLAALGLEEGGNVVRLLTARDGRRVARSVTFGPLRS